MSTPEDAMALLEQVYEDTAGEIRVDYIAKGNSIAISDTAKSMIAMEKLLAEISKQRKVHGLKWEIGSWNSWRDNEGKWHFQVKFKAIRPGGSYLRTVENMIETWGDLAKAQGVDVTTRGRL